MATRISRLKDMTHHMVMACMAVNMEYLSCEVRKLKDWMETYKASVDEMSLIKEVSLQAAMDGKLSCIEFMHREGVPMDELCPIIAACHGKRDVVMFCQKIGLGNIKEAWSRYYNWMVCPHDDDMDDELMLADEWASYYRKVASFQPARMSIA